MDGSCLPFGKGCPRPRWPVGQRGLSAFLQRLEIARWRAATKIRQQASYQSTDMFVWLVLPLFNLLSVPKRRKAFRIMVFCSSTRLFGMGDPSGGEIRPSLFDWFNLVGGSGGMQSAPGPLWPSSGPDGQKRPFANPATWSGVSEGHAITAVDLLSACHELPEENYALCPWNLIQEKKGFLVYGNQ